MGNLSSASTTAYDTALDSALAYAKNSILNLTKELREFGDSKSPKFSSLAYGARLRTKAVWEQVFNFFKRNQPFSGTVIHERLRTRASEAKRAADYAWLNESTSSQLDRAEEAAIWTETLGRFEADALRALNERLAKN